MTNKRNIQKKAGLAKFPKIEGNRKTTEKPENVTCMKVYMRLNK